MRHWDYTCKNGTALRNAIWDNDLGYAISMIRACISEIVRHYAKEDEDSGLVSDFDDLYCLMDGDDELVADPDFCDDFYDDAEELVNSRLAEFYDLCDEYDIWVEM